MFSIRRYGRKNYQFEGLLALMLKGWGRRQGDLKPLPGLAS